MTKLLISISLLLAPTQEYNCIYYGSDVSWAGFKNSNSQVAIQIDNSGTVTIYLGAIVPNLKKDGQPVTIKQVRIKK